MGTVRSMLMVSAVVAVSVFGMPADAQPQSRPGEAIPRDRTDDPVEPTRPMPVQRAVPTVRTPGPKDLPEGENALPSGTHLAEGTFLTRREGRLLRARTGDVIFLPAPDGQGRELPAMVLMPSQRLGQIEAAMGAPGFSGAATLGGQVFMYRGREYLLPTSFAQAPKAEPARPPTDQPSGQTAMPGEPQPSQPAPGAPASEQADPRAEDLIRELESQRSAPRALEPGRTPQPTAESTHASPAAPEPEPRSLLGEGTVITFKRGRLIRLPDFGGRIAFAFDNDPNSPAPAPMIIQACGQLERLESLAAAQGDSLAIKMSGRVMTYSGRNYLLPTLVQSTRSGEVVPMQ